jgi:predicted ATPase
MHAARELGEQLLELAERAGDPALLMLARWAQGWNLFALGKLASARAHLEGANHLYEPGQHHALAFGYGLDPGVACLSWLSWALWLLGYPEQALERSQQALELARELDHPVSLAFAQATLAALHIFLGDVAAVHALAEACIQLSAEYGLSHLLASAAFSRGWALVREGQTEMGLADMRQAIREGRAGGEVGLPASLTKLAASVGLAGQPAAGLPLLAEALATAGRTGTRYYEAEIHRLRGELLNQGGADPDDVEPHYQQAIQVARQQEARSWELRAVMSLCRLWHSQGAQANTQEARGMLAETYGWFSEGFDTGDLGEARKLLEKLPPDQVDL